jgi:PKD repeat protein
MTDPFPRIGPRVEAEPISVEVPNLPPVAEFTSSDVSGTGSNPAHTESFTDQSTDSDGTIVSRVWDYGDTAAPTKPTAKFTSSTSGLTASFTDTSTAHPPGRASTPGTGTSGTARRRTIHGRTPPTPTARAAPIPFG